ncbi:MAG: site-2 protease family protein [Candidatus Colwellbacteria bacterium]|nr:site-2 protease family protein [Candidatus Colwellbacteria bacterium]
MNDLSLLIFQLGVLLFSVVIHEVMHGFVALQLGDPTAKDAGRLTLNPVKHIDPVGSLLLPALLKLTNSPVIFGWARPVPYNPNLLSKDYRYGPLKVALAGPASNLLIALVFAVIIRSGANVLGPVLVPLLGFIVFLNCVLAVFNLMPIPPLDGSKILTAVLPSRYALALETLGLTGFFLVIMLLYFLGNIIFEWSFSLFVLFVGVVPAQEFIRFFGS